MPEIFSVDAQSHSQRRTQLAKLFRREHSDVVGQHILFKASELITIDDGRVLQTLLDTDTDFGGEPHAEGIYGRTQDSICIGIEQLLTAYNNETTGLF
jgi:hypothetical protein